MSAQRLKYGIAALCVLMFAGVWLFVLAPLFPRLATNFILEADIVSSDNFYDLERGEYTGEIYSQTEYRVETISQDNGRAILRNYFSVETPEGEAIFSTRRLLGIDRHTLRHMPDFGDREREGYLFAPPGLKEGESFTYWHVNYDGPARMQYVGKDVIHGLAVFRYETSFEGVDIDQTESLTHLPGVGTQLGVNLDPHLEVWVEPKTGRLVNYQDQTIAYYYDLETGKRLHPWNQFSNTLHDSSVKGLVSQIAQERLRRKVIDTYIPGALVLVGILLALQAWRFWNNDLVRKVANSMPQIGALMLMAGGGVVLAGWVLDVSFLIRPFPASAAVNPMTALCFTLVGAVMWLGKKNRVWPCAIAGGTLLFLSLVQLVGSLGISPIYLDLILFQEAVRAQTLPARMSQYTATLFVLFALIPLFQVVKSRLKLRIPEVISGLILVFSAIATIGELLDGIPLLEVPFFFSLSPVTIMGFWVAGLAGFAIFRNGDDSYMRFRSWILIWAISVLSLLTTASIVVAVDVALKRQAYNLYSREVTRAVGLIQERVDVYIGALEGARGLLSASDFVSRNEWRIYVESLDLQGRYPGIQGIGYAILVSPEELDTHIAQIRAEGFPEYTVRPAGERDPYTAIIYLEPFDERNRQAFGFDMYQEPTRRAAMDAAADSGQPRLSGRITLVQEIDEDVQPGFLIYVPYYGGPEVPDSLEERRRRIVGYAYAPFRARNFIEGIIGTDGLENIRLMIVDGANAVEDPILYDDRFRSTDSLPDARFTEQQTLYVAGRPWTFVFESAPDYGRTAYARVLTIVVLMAGLTVSFLLIAIFSMLITSGERAKAYARKLNADLLAAKAKDDAVLSSIADGLIVTDPSGVIMLVNEAFERMLGWTKEEAVGKHLTELVEMQDEQGRVVKSTDRLLNRALKTGSTVSTKSETLQYKGKDGAVLPVAITVAPILQDQKMVGAVEVFRDVSTERAMDRAKTELVSLASHQLRTPLSATGWYAQMLLDGDAGPLSKQQRDFVQEIANGNVRMVELVNALLNVSRIELGTFTVNPVKTDLAAVADSVIQELAVPIKEKQLHVVREYDRDVPPLLLDQDLTRIILQNLISNAVKYTPNNGRISVKIYRYRPQRVILIEVQDTGIGIPKEQASNVFTKMFRADNVRRVDPDGNGLGLYIVKSILDQVGGHIAFTSEEGKGSAFRVGLLEEGMRSRNEPPPASNE